MLLLCLAITISVVAWGYLVYAAIDFGSAARGGETNAWIYLGVACLGAAGCLFIGLMLGARVLRAVGIFTDPAAQLEPEPEPETPDLSAATAEESNDRLGGVTPTLTVSPVIEIAPQEHAETGDSPAPAAPAAPAAPTHTTASTPTAPPAQTRPATAEGVVPAPRSGESPRPRGKRIAEKGYSPDGPRQSGGRRIAR